MNKSKKIIWAIGIVLIVAVALFIWLGTWDGIKTNSGSTRSTLKIVAAENFYGDIARQLGGGKVEVTIILSDPNVDPHEYESTVQDGIAITDANVVIENGANYDSWMDKLLSASSNSDRVVVNAASLATNALPDNPHLWYDIDAVSATARAITAAMEKVDPIDTPIFSSNFIAFNASLDSIRAKMNEIKAAYAGTPVGLTETIFLYQTREMGLNVLTPLDFEMAVAEGNDPSPQSVKVTNDQIAARQVKVLIYNSQTVTPITSNLQKAAMANNIPVVPVTETMPANITYQGWMMGQLDALQNALAQASGK